MRFVLRATTRLHVWLYRATGGRIGGHVKKARIMLLTTTGRRTGKARTTPVSYVAFGNDIAVCGANLGSDHHPAWVRNIQGDPHVRVTIGRHTCRASARTVHAEERDNLWAQLTDQLPALAADQAKPRGPSPSFCSSVGNWHACTATRWRPDG